MARGGNWSNVRSAPLLWEEIIFETVASISSDTKKITKLFYRSCSARSWPDGAPMWKGITLSDEIPHPITILVNGGPAHRLTREGGWAFEGSGERPWELQGELGQPDVPLRGQAVALWKWKVSLELQGLDKRPEKLREAYLSILIRDERQTATTRKILVATGGWNKGLGSYWHFKMCQLLCESVFVTAGRHDETCLTFLLSCTAKRKGRTHAALWNKFGIWFWGTSGRQLLLREVNRVLYPSPEVSWIVWTRQQTIKEGWSGLLLSGIFVWWRSLRRLQWSWDWCPCSSTDINQYLCSPHIKLNLQSTLSAVFTYRATAQSPILLLQHKPQQYFYHINILL